MRKRTYDPVGQRFGRLVVQELGPPENSRKAFVLCDCGTTKWVNLHNITRGITKSCGCWRRDRLRTHGEGGKRTPHGRRPLPEYKSWAAMLQRCTNPNNPRFKDYGGRGIAVCKSWHRYENFLKDMGRCPAGKTLERRNNAKGYTPTNCYWATPLQQSQNQRSTRLLTYKGRCQCLSAWARELGIATDTLRERLERKWPIDAIFSPRKYRGPSGLAWKGKP